MCTHVLGLKVGPAEHSLITGLVDEEQRGRMDDAFGRIDVADILRGDVVVLPDRLQLARRAEQVIPGAGEG